MKILLDYPNQESGTSVYRLSLFIAAECQTRRSIGYYMTYSKSKVPYLWVSGVLRDFSIRQLSFLRDSGEGTQVFPSFK